MDETSAKNLALLLELNKELARLADNMNIYLDHVIKNDMAANDPGALLIKKLSTDLVEKIRSNTERQPSNDDVQE
jgi:hypothetical protein